MIRHLWAVTSLVTKALKFTTHSYDETIETTTKDGSVESDGIIRNVSLLNSAKRTAAPHAFKIRWKILFFIIFLHVSAVYGVWLMLTSAQWKTFIFTWIYYIISCLGLTAGAHRLFAHKSYKATWQLRLMLMIFQSTTYQYSVADWVKNHRVHHKYSDTDADPHNASRGFWYSHIGWVIYDNHPAFVEASSKTDISDLLADPILNFQHKYYGFMIALFTIAIPILCPMYFWGETFENSLFFTTMFRFVAVSNATFLINSAAHMIGLRPYDSTINPSENRLVSIVFCGEGWHNYHHAFPWDYKAAELGNYRMNFATGFIDLMAKIGWAYDLKTVSKEMIQKRALRTGDGTFT